MGPRSSKIIYTIVTMHTKNHTHDSKRSQSLSKKGFKLSNFEQCYHQQHRLGKYSFTVCAPFISLKYLCSSPALGALPLSVVNSHSHVSWGGGGGGATVPLTVAGSILSGCANLLSGGHACKREGVGENPRPAKGGIPVLYVLTLSISHRRPESPWGLYPSNPL